MNIKTAVGQNVVALVVYVMLQLLVVQASFGQGTMGTLPDPMTGRELDGYADRLALSEEQRRAIGRFYDQYQEQFRALRDGEIADFLSAMQELQRSGTQFPDRRQMERFGQLWDRARARIRAVDEQFFDSIQIVLTEDQLAMVERVRMARERHRTRGEMSFGGTTPAHDLSETLLRMNLTPEERERIDPLVANYERRLTRAIREQSDASHSMMFDMYDALEEIGFSEEAMADPEEMTRLMGEMQRIMVDIFGRMAKHDEALRMLNYRTYRSLVDLLDEQRRRPFRDEFTRGTFHELHFIARSGASRRFAAVLSIDDLEDTFRGAVTDAQRAFESERDGVFSRALQFASEHYRSPLAAMFGGEPDEAYDTKLAELSEQAGRIERRGLQALQELLPQEYEEKVTERVAEMTRSEHVEELARQQGAMGGQVMESVETVASTSGDPFVPGPISTRDTAIYADLLALDEDSRVLLDELHADYSRRFEQEISDVMTQLAQARQQQWQFDPETQTSRGPDAQRIADVYDLRRKAMSAIIAVDESFFDDLELVLVDTSMERARLARARGRYTATSRFAAASDRGGGYADLADVVRLLRWSAEKRRAIEQPLLEWERAIVAPIAECFEALLAVDEAGERFFAEMREMTESRDMAQWQEFSERRRKAIGPHQQRLRAARTAMRQATDSAREAIIASLGDDDAAVFVDGYKRRAFPSVYNDRRAVHTQLRSALNLPDLPQSSRDALMELNLSYNARYHELTERMVEVRRRSRNDMQEVLDESDMADYLEEESVYSRLSFERNELNDAAIRQMRGLLNREHRELIGALP